MRQVDGEVEEERTPLVGGDEARGFLDHEVGKEPAWLIHFLSIAVKKLMEMILPHQYMAGRQQGMCSSGLDSQA